MLSFDWPWLLLLLPLPELLRRLLPPVRQSRAALRVPFYAELGGSDPHAPAGGWRWSRALRWLIWLALLLAAARPAWVGPPMPMAASGRDLMLAVDISGSMETADMVLDGEPADRLSAVKRLLEQFIARRAGDRLGLVLFGSEAYVQTPLTFDHRSLGQLLDEAQIGFAGEKTALGDAIGMGVRKLRERPAGSRVMILLTDGANTAGRVAPLEAARVAADEGVRVYTLGFGADEMLVPGLFGARRVNPSADLDEQTLKGIAETTGGRYFRARDVDELEAVYRELDRLEPVAQAAEPVRPRRQLFYWPLALALLASLGGPLLLLGERRRPAGGPEEGVHG